MLHNYSLKFIHCPKEYPPRALLCSSWLSFSWTAAFSPRLRFEKLGGIWSRLEVESRKFQTAWSIYAVGNGSNLKFMNQWRNRELSIEAQTRWRKGIYMAGTKKTLWTSNSAEREGPYIITSKHMILQESYSPESRPTQRCCHISAVNRLSLAEIDLPMCVTPLAPEGSVPWGHALTSDRELSVRARILVANPGTYRTLIRHWQACVICAEVRMSGLQNQKCVRMGCQILMLR